MPKVGISEISNDFNQGNLEDPMSKIEWLLEGKMDGDNLMWDGDTHVVIPSGKVQDSPYNNNPVYGNKFMPYAASANFKTNIWDSLFDILAANPQYTLATSAISFSITPLTQEVKSSKMKKRELSLSFDVLSVEDAEIDKPEHHKLLYVDDTTQTFRRTPKNFQYTDAVSNVTKLVSQPAIIPTFTATYNFKSTKEVGIDMSFDLQDLADKTIVSVKLRMPSLDTEEYLYLGLRFLCLYEVLL